MCVHVGGLSSEGAEPPVPLVHSKGPSRCKEEHVPSRARSRCPGALQPEGAPGKGSRSSSGSGGGRCARSGRRGSLCEAGGHSGPGAAGSIPAMARTPPKLPLPAGEAREPQAGGEAGWLLAGLKPSPEGEERTMGTRGQQEAEAELCVRSERTAAPIRRRPSRCWAALRLSSRQPHTAPLREGISLHRPDGMRALKPVSATQAPAFPRSFPAAPVSLKQDGGGGVSRGAARRPLALSGRCVTMAAAAGNASEGRVRV